LTGGEFVKVTLKLAVCGGLNPTGTVAVVGVIATRIPESRVTVAVAVLLWSASAVAVKVRVGGGTGKLLSAGAVYVSTFDPFVLEVTQVPMLPPFRLWPDVHVPVTAFGFGLEVVDRGV
jgi:hypothetical protein